MGSQVLGAWMLGPYIEMGCEDGSRPSTALLTGVYDRDTASALCRMGSPEVSRQVHNVKKRSSGSCCHSGVEEDCRPRLLPI